MVIVGAGHAGLSIARALAAHRIEHAVLERDRIAQTWRTRWDSFCLVTPNWFIDLPGGGYDGDAPDGYMPRDEIAAFLERYAVAGDVPVREGVAVIAVRTDDRGFVVETSTGSIRTRVLVAASGAYQRQHRPRGADTIPARIHIVDATSYRRPEDLPDGGVLIVGSGQTGVQLAEELHGADRDVVLACGKAPWLPRRWGGHDVTWWADATGFLAEPVASLPDPTARLWANILATGRDGGHDLHYRTLQRDGVTLAGHFAGVEGDAVRFEDDLAASVAWGDERYTQFGRMVRRVVAERGLDPVELPPPAPFVSKAPTRVGVDRFSTVLFAGGFRPDYGSMLPWPEAFDALGFPLQTDGESSVVEGLYFMGAHFLRTRKSSILWGANEDATVVARRIAARLGAGPAD